MSCFLRPLGCDLERPPQRSHHDLHVVLVREVVHVDGRILAVIGAFQNDLAFAVRLDERRHQNDVLCFRWPRRVEAEFKVPIDVQVHFARPGRRVVAARNAADLSVVSVTIAEPGREERRGVVQRRTTQDPDRSFATRRIELGHVGHRHPGSGVEEEQRDLQVILQMLADVGGMKPARNARLSQAPSAARRRTASGDGVSRSLPRSRSPLSPRSRSEDRRWRIGTRHPSPASVRGRPRGRRESRSLPQ